MKHNTTSTDIINSMFFENHCDFYNSVPYKNIDGNTKIVDTLCGTISSLNLIRSDPFLRKKILNKKHLSNKYHIFNNILTETKKIIIKEKPEQKDFENYINNVSSTITKYLNKKKFNKEIQPNNNGDLICQIKKEDNCKLLENLFISKNGNNFYPYDDFIYKLLQRSGAFSTKYNYYQEYYKKDIEQLFKPINQTTKMNIGKMKELVQQIKEKFEAKEKKIITNIKIIFDHNQGGHIVTFVRNNKNTLDYIGAERNEDNKKKQDTDNIDIRYMKIQSYRPRSLEIIHKTKQQHK